MHNSQPNLTRLRPQLELIRPVHKTFEAVGGTISCRLIDSLAELDTLEHEWTRLGATSPTASAPLRWSWVREWWRLFHTPARSLAVITVRRGSELIGVLPLYREKSSRGRVRAFFVSASTQTEDSFYPEYTDILAAPHCAEICGDAIAATIMRGEMGPVDEWFFGLARTDGPLATLVAPRINSGFRIHVQTRHLAPQVDLRGGFETYLARCSASSRQQFRRLLKSFHQTAGARFDIAMSPTDGDEIMLDLIAVHQHHWHAAGQPGAFSTPRRVEFHRSVVRHPDTSAVLARLTVNGHTVSALYGFIVGRTFEFYQSGTSRADSPLKRPGILSHLLLMEHLATRGIERYDLLAGATPYKIQLSTASRELTELSLQRPTPRLVWAHALRTLRATLASPRSTP